MWNVETSKNKGDKTYLNMLHGNIQQMTAK